MANATFEVDVGGATYEVDAPDETTAWKWANATHKAQPKPAANTPAAAPAPAQRALTKDNPNIIDRAVINFLSDKPRLTNYIEKEAGQGSKFGRFVQGAADLPLGAMQLGMNAVGLGDKINPELAAINDRTNALRGPDAGYDWYRLLGNVVNPAPIMAVSGMPVAASALGKAAQGGVLGALFGAGAPVTSGDDYLGNKAAQIGGGAVLGAAIPPLASLLQSGAGIVRNVVDPILPGGTQRAAARLANTAAGPRRAAVIAALDNPQTIVPGSTPNAGVAAVPAGSAEIAALQKAASERLPSEYLADDVANQAARLNAIRSIGQTPEALDAAIAERAANAGQRYGAISGNRVDARSDMQIMQDAIAAKRASQANAMQTQGRYATVAAQQEQLGAGRGPTLSPMQTAGEPQINVGVTGGQARSPSAYPVEGQPRIPARYTSNMERVPEARSAASDAANIALQRRSEAEFLDSTMNTLKNTVGMDSKPLQFFLSRPSMRAAVQDAMKSAQETGSYFPTRQGEQFSIQNLQRIKESLDEGIKAAKKAAEAGVRPKLSPAELEGTRREFIKWLSNKSPDWREARMAYAAESKPINQMQVGQYLEEKLAAPLGNVERAGAFTQAVRDAPTTIKRATTGGPRYEKLSDVLTPQQEATVNAVGQDLQRNAKFEELAARGGSEVTRMTGGNIPQAPPPGMFDPKISAARSWINRLLRGATDSVMKELAVKMRDPAQFSMLMKSATPLQRQQIADAIVRYQGLGQEALMAQDNK